MRLREERIEALAERIVEALEDRGDLVDIAAKPGVVGAALADAIAADLKIEGQIAEEAVAKVESYGRTIEPGSAEWELLVEKHKQEIADRRNYVIA